MVIKQLQMPRKKNYERIIYILIGYYVLCYFSNVFTTRNAFCPSIENYTNMNARKNYSNCKECINKILTCNKITYA